MPARASGADQPEVGRAALSASNVVVRLGGRRVLDGVDLELRAGELLAVVGPNGAGKTTLLRSLAGLLPLRDGRVRLDGKEIGALSRRQIARRLAYLPQETHTGFSLTVGEVVQLGRYAHVGALRGLSAEDREAAESAMRQADVAHLGERRVNSLSGGERRRVFLARVIAQQSAVLVLDEPTSALDVGHALSVLRLLRSLADEKRAVIFSLHELSLGVRAPDRVLLLDGGRCAGAGPPAEVLTSEAARAAFGVRLALSSDARAVIPVDSLPGEET